MIIRETTSPPFLATDVAKMPVIGWVNFITINNIESTSEDPSFPATNLANVATHLKWKEPASSPLSTADIYITITIPSDVSVSPPVQQAIDYIAIAKHNFGSAGCTVTVQSTTDSTSPIGGYVDVVSNSPTDDNPIIFQFEQRQPTFIRLKITAGSILRQAAVVYVGNLLTIERGIKIDIDHTPINLGRRNDVLNGMSESGNFLGRIIRNHTRESQAQFSHITPAWYRANLDPFIAESHDLPFFWAWDPSNNPTDVGFVWTTKDAIPEINPITGRFALTLDMRGVA